MVAREAFLDGGDRGAGQRRWFVAMAELGVGHGNARWGRSESAHVSAMARDMAA
jgi:hypothetical protein